LPNGQKMRPKSLYALALGGISEFERTHGQALRDFGLCLVRSSACGSFPRFIPAHLGGTQTYGLLYCPAQTP
jgi:hypothetical protein